MPAPPVHHPRQAPEPLRVQRRVDCRGALVVAKQRVHDGVVHAGRTLTVEAGDSTWRAYDEDGLVAEVARITAKPVARFKVNKRVPAYRIPPGGPASPSETAVNNTGLPSWTDA